MIIVFLIKFLVKQFLKKSVVNIKEFTFFFVFTMQRWRWPASVKEKAQKP